MQPNEILAITFTNRAAREMVERVGSLLGGRARGMWVMTFHAACARILRAEASRIGYRSSFTIYDQPDQVRLVRDVLEDELEKDPKRYPPRGVHARISDAKNRLVGPTQFAAEVNGFFDQTVAEVYGRYQRRLSEAGAMDFDDLLMQTVMLLEQVPDVRAKWQRAFRYVLVDEYQDTNHAQYRLVRALLGAARQRLRRRRLRPVDLLVARRRHPQHPRLRARLPATPRSSGSSRTTARRRASSTPRTA